MTEVKYGLRIKGSDKLLNLMETPTRDQDFCNSTECELVPYDDYPRYLVSSAMTAEYARQWPSKWYSSTFAHPMHNFKAEDLEVVKVVITIEVQPEKVSLPDPKEYFAFKQKTDKGYVYLEKQWMEEGKAQGLPPYDMWALKEYVRAQEGEVK